jgi:hypothetical protein
VRRRKATRKAGSPKLSYSLPRSSYFLLPMTSRRFRRDQRLQFLSKQLTLCAGARELCDRGTAPAFHRHDLLVTVPGLDLQRVRAKTKRLRGEPFQRAPGRAIHAPCSIRAPSAQHKYEPG